MSSMRLTQMTGKHQPATLVDLLHLTQRNNWNENLSQDSGRGGCNPLTQLDNLPSLLHTVPEALGTTRLASEIFRTNPKEQMTKDVVWKVFIQTNSKEIDPKPDDS